MVIHAVAGASSGHIAVCKECYVEVLCLFICVAQRSKQRICHSKLFHVAVVEHSIKSRYSVYGGYIVRSVAFNASIAHAQSVVGVRSELKR